MSEPRFEPRTFWLQGNSAVSYLSLPSAILSVSLFFLNSPRSHLVSTSPILWLQPHSDPLTPALLLPLFTLINSCLPRQPVSTLGSFCKHMTQRNYRTQGHHNEDTSAAERLVHVFNYILDITWDRTGYMRLWLHRKCFFSDSLLFCLFMEFVDNKKSTE